VVHQASKVITDFVAGLRNDFDATVDAFVQLCIPEEGSDHLRAWLADIIRRTGSERTARLQESFYGVDLSDRLGELAMPTVAIHGEHDVFPASRVEAARQMVDKIPNGELVVLPGVGHVPTLTRPGEVAAVIERLAEKMNR
jgi:pimeloyl-ACP methyl ester carboxylesterase